MNKTILFLILLLPTLLLAESAESAEIKMLIAEVMRPAAMKKLEMKANSRPEVSISFFDTATAMLDGQKLILRVRQEHPKDKAKKSDKDGKAKDAGEAPKDDKKEKVEEMEKGGKKEEEKEKASKLDAVVKLRGATKPDGDFPNVETEEDWVGPGAAKTSHSIKVDKGLDPALVADVLAGYQCVDDVLSPEQRNFAAACLGRKVPWGDLHRYGLIEAWKSKRKIKDYSEEVTVELWKLTTTACDPLELLEVSIKVSGTPEEIKAKAAAFYAAAEKAGLGVPTGASKTSEVIKAFKPGK